MLTLESLGQVAALEPPSSGGEEHAVGRPA
jgi:hypothetical protein